MLRVLACLSAVSLARLREASFPDSDPTAISRDGSFDVSGCGSKRGGGGCERRVAGRAFRYSVSARIEFETQSGLPADDAVAILDTAPERGIVHRDLEPAKIKISR